MLQTTEYYQIYDGSGWIADDKGKSYFETRGEAIDAATNFKNDPRSHNPKMTDDNVAYWKKKTYTIEKVTTTILTLDSI